jgi:hypothetical protein
MPPAFDMGAAAAAVDVALHKLPKHQQQLSIISGYAYYKAFATVFG